MKKNESKGLILALLSLFFMSCSLPNGTGTGSLSFNVVFPANSNKFSIKAIPKDTDKLKIKITGEGILETAPILQEVDKKDALKDENGNYTSAVKIITDIPKGDKTVKVEAVNSNGDVLADAEKTVTIKPQNEGNTKLEIELVEKITFTNLTLNLNNYPTGVDFAIAYLKTADGKITVKEFSDKVLKLDNIPVGQTYIKTVVFADKPLPIAIGEYNLAITKDSTEFTEDLKPVTLPDKVELNFDKSQLNPKIAPNLQELLPKDLSTLLDLAFTDIQNNTAPTITDVKVSIKDKEQAPSLFYYASPGDDITIDISAQDNENDKIYYLWGTTILGRGDSTASFASLKESSSKITVTAPDKVGSFYIGVILTDRKSKSQAMVIPVGINN